VQSYGPSFWGTSELDLPANEADPPPDLEHMIDTLLYNFNLVIL